MPQIIDAEGLETVWVSDGGSAREMDVSTVQGNVQAPPGTEIYEEEP